MANFGQAFWGGAAAGANMAGKWIDAYNTAEDRGYEDQFRQGAKAIETDWKKAQKHASGLSNEADRAKYLNNARRAMQDSYRSLAYSTKGSAGTDVYGKHVLNMDNTEKMLNNADTMRNREVGGQDMRNAYYGKTLWLINAARNGDSKVLEAFNTVGQLFGGSTVGVSDGVLTWGPADGQVPMDMGTMVEMGNRFFGVSDAATAYQDSKKKKKLSVSPVVATRSGTDSADNIRASIAGGYNGSASMAKSMISAYHMNDK